MSKLPEKTRKRLKEESQTWDTSIAKEKSQKVEELLNQAKPFIATQPVSSLVDPFDISMAKRIARRKGIPFTQLMSMWLHEKIEQEKNEAGI
jgi:hypothetical protein